MLDFNTAEGFPESTIADNQQFICVIMDMQL